MLEDTPYNKVSENLFYLPYFFFPRDTQKKIKIK